MKKTVFLTIAFALCACHKPIVFQEAVHRADSCYMANDYKQANRFFKQAFRAKDAKPQNFHYANAASVAALAGDSQTAFKRLNQLIENDKEWYSPNFAKNPDYLSLHDYPEWQVLQDTIEERQRRIEKNFDHELIARLQTIFSRDQDPRHAFLFACQTNADDHLKDSLIREMQRADSINLIEIQDILQSYGFPSKAIVGTANVAIWTVIQHSDVEFQKACYPMLQQAAEKGELNRSNVALLEDRINMFEGRPQRYGSQVVENAEGEHVIYTLLNKDSVDVWRKAAGLNPLSDYAKQMNAKIE